MALVPPVPDSCWGPAWLNKTYVKSAPPPEAISNQQLGPVNFIVPDDDDWICRIIERDQRLQPGSLRLQPPLTGQEARPHD